MTRDAVRHLFHLSRCAGRNDFAAAQTRARADVYQIISGADGVFVVFHHQDGVAQIAQMFQCPDQTFVVALVQADAGFVQHIQHALQARANLRCQTDTLGFAAGECGGAAQQVQVVQANVLHELQTSADFLDDLFGNVHFLVREFDGIKVRDCLVN